MVRQVRMLRRCAVAAVLLAAGWPAHVAAVGAELKRDFRDSGFDNDSPSLLPEY